MSGTPFNPKDHMMKISGKEYLPVAARLVWFRQDHPDWGIITSPVEINTEKQYAIFSCSIFNTDGKLMATGHKSENVRGFGDWLEKAEAGSIGRALAYVGYGTQFAPELDEGERLADSPQPPRETGEQQRARTREVNTLKSQFLDMAAAYHLDLFREGGDKPDMAKVLAVLHTIVSPDVPSVEAMTDTADWKLAIDRLPAYAAETAAQQ